MYADIETPYPQAQWLGDPHMGDVDQGVGVSTSQMANVNVAIGEARPIASGPPLMQSPGVWIFIALLLVGVKYLSESAGEKSEFATTRIGLENWFINGSMAATFFYVTKIGATLLPVPGAVKQFFGAI